VLTVTRDAADPVQVVNYTNPFRSGSGALAESALASAAPEVLGTLAVVDVPHLVALKLYAGGRKSTLDVLELLDRNPDVDRGRFEICVLGLACKTSGEAWLTNGVRDTRTCADQNETRYRSRRGQPR
jgi:hypothetical protein